MRMRWHKYALQCTKRTQSEATLKQHGMMVAFRFDNYFLSVRFWIQSRSVVLVFYRSTVAQTIARCRYSGFRPIFVHFFTTDKIVLTID